MASITDKITDVRNAARPNSARVSVGRSGGGTTLSCDNLAGWPTASKVHFVTYTIDSNSNPVAGTQLDCSGIVSGNSIGSLVVIDGTDTGNSINDVVEMLPTAAWGQDLADALTNEHTRTGTHDGITNTNGLTTDTITTSGAAVVGTTLGVTGATTLAGAVGGAGYDVKTIANSYKFLVYRNAAQNTGGTGFAIVNFDTAVFDTGSNVDLVTNKGRFTAPVTGFYRFDWIATIDGNAGAGGDSQFMAALYKNGSIIRSGNTITTRAATAASNTCSGGGTLLSLNATDYIEVYTYFNTTAQALKVGSQGFTELSGSLVSKT